MECENDIDSERLKKISKIVFPIFLIIAVNVAGLYKSSADMLEISIVDKEIEFDDFNIYYIETENETLITSKDIYSRLEIGCTYIVEAKGWTFAGSYRTLINVYRKTL